MQISFLKADNLALQYSEQELTRFLTMKRLWVYLITFKKKFVICQKHTLETVAVTIFNCQQTEKNLNLIQVK